MLGDSFRFSNHVGGDANTTQPIVGDKEIVEPSTTVSLSSTKDHDMNAQALADSTAALIPGSVAQQFVVGGGVVPSPAAKFLVLV
jgi:hypothetical protein